MKLLSTIFLALIINVTMHGQVLNDAGKVVKVLSFNILHGATTRGDYDLDVIARVISDADPDLVALQEVDFKTERAKRYDLATELAWRVKMAPLFARAMYYDGGEYGEAILSKYSFISTRNVPLPFTRDHEPRTALEAVIILPSGDTIAFIGTHLDHMKKENDRLAQVKKINEEFTASPYPVILAGDLNAQPGSIPISILEEKWSSSYDKDNPVPTFPSDDPQVKIDYVMHFPKDKWETLETKVICDTIASDHCAYLVIVKLLDE
jgi:endonuclease/exonuclease/phosphatase family metal-dependent hydrolase